MKALVVYGGWAGHEPEKVGPLLAKVLADRGVEVATSETLDAFNELDPLLELDLIVPCWTMGKLTGEQGGSLCEAVRQGVGIAGVHGGMGDAFREHTEYQFMVGGQFVAHPGGQVDYRVHVVDRADPITAGIDDFDFHSEQYYLHTDPSNEVLATTTFGGEHCPWIEGTVMPVVWKRMWGAGRVFYTSLGHVAEDFNVPEAREIVERGMLWASR